MALTAAVNHGQLRRDEFIGYHTLYGSSDDGQISGQLSIDDLQPSVDLDHEGEVSREYPTAAITLGIHPDAVRPDLAPSHAAPPPRPRRGRGPHHLVCGPARHRGDHRRGRRRQDRRHAGGHRRPGPSRHVIIYLANPTIGVRGMLTHIVAALGHTPAYHKATLAPQAADALAAEHAERGRNPVLVVDEAHLLDNHQLEAIRLLTNHEMDSGSPFALVLVGQPTLRQRLRLGALAALDQRIAVRYAIAGMAPPTPPTTYGIIAKSPDGPTPCSPGTRSG